MSFIDNKKKSASESLGVVPLYGIDDPKKYRTSPKAVKQVTEYDREKDR